MSKAPNFLPDDMEYLSEAEEYANQMYYSQQYCMEHELDFSLLPCYCDDSRCTASDCPQCELENSETYDNQYSLAELTNL